VDIRITDLTEMSPGNYCVAGWDAAAQRMIRPLPNGANWTAATLQQFGVTPGALLRLAPAGNANGEYPHLTEDTPIDLDGTSNIITAPMQWFDAEAPKVAATIAEAFEGQLQANSQFRGTNQGNYVARGTRTRSLWAVNVPRNNISFTDPFDSLKAVISDVSGSYQFAVSSKAIKEAWRIGGTAQIERLLPKTGQLHVRLGLARAYGDAPDKCYVMVNGIYW
jgi:hypothetical protein